MALKNYIPAIKYGYKVGFDECEASHITACIPFVATGSLAATAMTTAVTLLADGSVTAVADYARVYITDIFTKAKTTGAAVMDSTTSVYVKDSAGTTLVTISTGSMVEAHRYYGFACGSIAAGSVVLYGQGATTNKGLTISGTPNSTYGDIYVTVTGFIKPYPA